MSDRGEGYSRSYLFTVRVWSVDMGSAATAIRGEVRYVVGGGVRYFQEWGTLVAYLAEKLQELEGRQKGGDKTADHVDV
jgi:hypothetical protein